MSPAARRDSTEELSSLQSKWLIKFGLMWPKQTPKHASTYRTNIIYFLRENKLVIK